MRLSYREKIILMVVVAIVTLVLGFSVIIKPVFTAIDTAKVSLTAKETEWTDIETKIKAGETLDETIKGLYKENADLAKFFMPEMGTVEIDQFISPLCTSLGIKLNELTMTLPAAIPSEFYFYEKDKVMYALKDSGDLNEEIPDGVEVMGIAVPEELLEEVYGVVVTIECTADNQQIEKFADTISGLNKSIILKSVSLSDDGGCQFILEFYSLRPLSELKN